MFEPDRDFSAISEHAGNEPKDENFMTKMISEGGSMSLSDRSVRADSSLPDSGISNAVTRAEPLKDWGLFSPGGGPPSSFVSDGAPKSSFKVHTKVEKVVVANGTQPTCTCGRQTVEWMGRVRPSITSQSAV